jgi:hypothetical protein
MAKARRAARGTSVGEFIESIADADRRKDAKAVAAMMRRATGERPAMWGSSIVGFGRFHYRYPSGREGDSMLIGFSPRARSLTIYVMSGFRKMKALLARLGKHATSVSCLYLGRLADVDRKVLEEIVRQAVRETKKLDCVVPAKRT